MGSSFREWLNRGDMPEWEEKLRKASGLLHEVIRDVYDAVSNEDQTDNAADTGALAGALSAAAHMIDAELPKRSQAEAQLRDLADHG